MDDLDPKKDDELREIELPEPELDDAFGHEVEDEDPLLPKRGKKDSIDEEDDSLDELAEAEFDEDEPYDDVDKL